jgi:hypothetical protein
MIDDPMTISPRPRDLDHSVLASCCGAPALGAAEQRRRPDLGDLAQPHRARGAGRQLARWQVRLPTPSYWVAVGADP